MSDLFKKAVEPDYYPNSRTFINLLDIRNYRELVKKESDFTSIRAIELLQDFSVVNQTFDFAHLSSIHKYLFQDLFSWAGKPRSFDMMKDGNIFTPAKDLAKYESLVFERSQHFIRTGPPPTIKDAAKKLASCLGIINIYHPFPEGNGRAQRIFISSLANYHQCYVDWNNASPWEIIETSKQVHIGNYVPLELLMLRLLKKQ